MTTAANSLWGDQASSGYWPTGRIRKMLSRGDLLPGLRSAGEGLIVSAAPVNPGRGLLPWPHVVGPSVPEGKDARGHDHQGRCTLGNPDPETRAAHGRGGAHSGEHSCAPWFSSPRRPGARWSGAVARPSVLRPDISPVGADRASVMRCRWALLLASGCCCCCHRCCQLLAFAGVRCRSLPDTRRCLHLGVASRPGLSAWAENSWRSDRFCRCGTV